MWNGSPKSKYGAINIGMGKRMSAHRFSHKLYRGEIPKGVNVCHKCDTPKCVNPKHLFLGTAKDNIRDCIKKKRFVFPPIPFGQKHRAKLNIKTATKIRTLYFNGKLSYRKIADMFDVSASTISNVIRNELWV